MHGVGSPDRLPARRDRAGFLSGNLGSRRSGEPPSWEKIPGYKVTFAAVISAGGENNIEGVGLQEVHCTLQPLQGLERVPTGEPDRIDVAAPSSTLEGPSGEGSWTTSGLRWSRIALLSFLSDEFPAGAHPREIIEH